MRIAFYQPICHGADHFHMALLTPRRRPPCPTCIAIGSLNIRDGRGFGLAQSIWEVERAVFDIMLLTDTKIQTEEYSHNRLGYDVICSAARPSSTGGAQVDVGLVLQEWTNGWGIESTRFHGLNVVSCKIMTGRIRC